MSEEIKQAMDTLSKAMNEDEGYLISWHANLAMALFDAMDDNCIDDHVKHCWCNDGASRFINLAFGIDYKPE
jgi:hypothetical protein